MVKLARNEQCIALYQLTPHYSFGLFLVRVIFWLHRAHLFLGSFPEFSYLRSVTGLVRLWAKFSPWLHSARLWPINTLGCFHSVIQCGILMAHDGPRIVRPMFCEMIIRPVEGPCDAEHPTFIPMYTPTTLQAPRGLMMRPQLDAIGHKVNSLLSEPSLSTCETWLLPPTCVLCMIRYWEESHKATTSNGRASEDAKYKDQETKLPEATATGGPVQPR